MTYHILHQFDEQWFGENSQTRGSQSNDSLYASGEEPYGSTRLGNKAGQRPLVITVLSIIVALWALYFAIDARKQTTDLQQRISELETRVKK